MLNEFLIHKIDSNEKDVFDKVKALLATFQLKPDIIDNCAVIYDVDDNVIATISSYTNTIKCLAVQEQYQGHNLVNKLVTFMIKEIYHAGWNEIFVFIKSQFIGIFKQLGFSSLYQNNIFAFLTNRYDLLQNYLHYLKEQKEDYPNTSIIVMNANPFSKGHLFLIEQAAQQSAFVYIIVVREEGSLFTYQQRMEMVQAGITNISNAKLLAGSQYLVSKNVFPSYFLASEKEVITQQTILDSNIFVKYIAKSLGATVRFVGTEPFSVTTNYYNATMQEILPSYGIKLVVVPRLQVNHQVISATIVRKFFLANDFFSLKPLVPASTYEYLQKIKRNTKKK